MRAPAVTKAAPHDADEAEFGWVPEWLSNPPPPTPAAIRGAETLRKLPTPNRPAWAWTPAANSVIAISNSPGDPTPAGKRLRARFLKAKSKPTAEAVLAARAAELRVEIVPDEEFAHFEECMNNPQGPTPALIKGVELLRSLWPKSR